VNQPALGCPHCRRALHRGLHGGTYFDACGGCGGVWLDNNVSVAITQHADAMLLSLVERVSSQAAPFAPLVVRPACPICAAALERFRIAEVDVDICRAHGTWFDREELHAVARAFENDRAARARAAAMAPRPLIAPCLRPSDVETSSYGAMDEGTASSVAADVTVGIVGFLIECAFNSD
jgi:Zn-finger nucleic acid-binding protein